MPLERFSCCKVNLVLNILGKRPDGFHELETVFLPVPLHDRLTFESCSSTDAIRLTCNRPDLPTDPTNLVWRAARLFLDQARIATGVDIHLEKSIPMAAGLGGGSGNAAVTLLALNELHGTPLDRPTLHELAAQLGSDVPFFLENRPALATGRGENLRWLDPFPCLAEAHLLLVRPAFGIATAWAYKELARFPEHLHGHRGRAESVASLFAARPLADACGGLYNSLEAPAFEKYPWLEVLKGFLIQAGAVGALMSGSGSTTFAITRNRLDAEQLAEKVRSRFGEENWIAIAPLA